MFEGNIHFGWLSCVLSWGLPLIRNGFRWEGGSWPLGARGLTCSEILLLALLAQALLLGVQEPMLVTSDKKALNPRTRFVAIANCHVAWGKPLGIYPYCHARAII